MGRISLTLVLLFISPVFAKHYDQLAVFDKTVDLVTRRFYDKTFRGLDWPLLVRQYRSKITFNSSDEDLKSILNELLAALKASHTEFVSCADQEYWAIQSIFSNRIDGASTKQIGAWFVQQDGKWFVKNVFEGSVAARAGLLVGDEILNVNRNTFYPVESFSGAALQTLSIKRSANKNPIYIKVRPVLESFQRSLLRASQKSFKLFNVDDKRVAYFHLWSGTNDAFKDALKTAATKATKRSDVFILDLRDGFGGASPEYLEPFTLYDKPLVVLINEGVRSGKEWIAYLLKETKRGTLIGSRTKGYFLAGMPFEILENHFLLYLAVNENPAAPRLEGNGVFPDIEVLFDLPYSEGRDPILEFALQYVRRL